MSLKDIDKSNIPRHVAVIMDGMVGGQKKEVLNVKMVIVKVENL